VHFHPLEIEHVRSRLPRLLPQRLSQAIREVLHLPAQRTLFQQSQRLRSQEKFRQPGRSPREFLEITDRFAAFQAQCLNVHVDFPSCKDWPCPFRWEKENSQGSRSIDTRMIRLLEILLHTGTKLAGWATQQIHEAVLQTYHLSPENYGLNQLVTTSAS